MYIQDINIENRVYNYCFDNLVKPKTIETENILTDKKNYKDFGISFTRYVHSKSIKMINLHSRELMEKIEENETKNISWLMIIY